MINVFGLRPPPTTSFVSDAELYYMGKDRETYEKFEGGRKFSYGNLYENLEDALNYLEDNGYTVIYAQKNPDEYYIIITRKI